MAWNIVYGGTGYVGGGTPTAVAYADLPNYSIPSNSQPALLGTYTDPWFPTQRVLRMTADGGNFPAAGGSRMIGSSYTKRAMETGDIVVTTGIWEPRILDRHTGEFIRTGQMPYEWASRKNANRVYGSWNNPGGSEVGWAYTNNARTGTTKTMVWNGHPTYTYCDMGIGEGQLDAEETHVALFCKRASDSAWEIKVLRLSDGTIIASKVTTYTGANASGGNYGDVSMSACGKYVLVTMFATQDGIPQGVNQFDRDTLTLIRTFDFSTNHWCTGLRADGVGVCVRAGGTNGELEMYSLETGLVKRVLNGWNDDPSVKMWRWNHHLSMICFDRPGWVYMSTMPSNMVSFQDYKGHNLLCAVELATGMIEPWGCSQHNESDVDQYHFAPMITPSFDGKRVYFNSTWRGTTTSDNAHLYQISFAG